MLKIIKITGDSMLNKYKNGDFVLILKSPFFKYLLKKERDVVFFKEPYGIMIKSIDKIDEKNQTLDLKGLNEKSISKELLKNIPYGDVLGVVIKKFN
ncbi:MAG: hypothetical protein CR959_01475 [Fusobacteriales bacterium]|nr:MAG: hypothetical protein CR959_01475 [Fusobacteriales bacterium]